MNSRRRPLSFGFCYFTQISRVEDFYPFWVIDDWNEEGVRKDFNIMKSLCLRSIIIVGFREFVVEDFWGEKGC